MRYDLGSYLSRKRISLEEFAAKNNIKSVNDVGMFILNNKEFELSDALVQKLTELCTEKEPENVEDMLIISPRNLGDGDDLGDGVEAAVAVITPSKETVPSRKGKKAVVHSSSVANRS